MERQSDERRRVPICTRWRIKLRVMTTIALLLSEYSCILTRYAHFVGALLSWEVGDSFLTCSGIFPRKS
jgi:hypothetical protein